MKVFASATMPEIFGFCGDARFSALVLSQAITAIDSCYLLSPDDTAAIKMKKVEQMLAMAWKTFPKMYIGYDTTILHLSREDEGVASRFWLKEHRFSKGTNGIMQSSTPQMAPLGECSRAWVVRGSGTTSVNDTIDSWNRMYKDRHTSRAVFKAFCESIRSAKDPNSGGPPQLVSLYRIGHGRPHGVIWNNSRYFQGLPTICGTQKDGVPWRNDSFEIVNQRHKSRKAGAAEHVSIIDFGAG